MLDKTLKDLKQTYSLDDSDFFTTMDGQLIVKRTGIEKIQQSQGIYPVLELVDSRPDYAVVKAVFNEFQTFGSAIRGDFGTVIKTKEDGTPYSYEGIKGSTSSYYVVETAEKRALSRLVLKFIGLYQHNVFGEDENEQEFIPSTKAKKGKTSKLSEKLVS